MKLRITEDTLRLRLSEQECKGLSELETLTNTCSFPGGETLSYSLSVSDKIKIALKEHHIKITINKDHVKVLLQKGTVSTSYQIKDHAMHLIVEQDLKSAHI